MAVAAFAERCAGREGVSVRFAGTSLRLAETGGVLGDAGVETTGAGFTAASPTTASVSCTGRSADVSGVDAVSDERTGDAAATDTGVVALWRDAR